MRVCKGEKRGGARRRAQASASKQPAARYCTRCLPRADCRRSCPTRMPRSFRERGRDMGGPPYRLGAVEARLAEEGHREAALEARDFRPRHGQGGAPRERHAGPLCGHRRWPAQLRVGQCLPRQLALARRQRHRRLLVRVAAQGGGGEGGGRGSSCGRGATGGRIALSIEQAPCHTIALGGCRPAEERGCRRLPWQSRCWGSCLCLPPQPEPQHPPPPTSSQHCRPHIESSAHMRAPRPRPPPHRRTRAAARLR
jgi:hypothetical protein